VFSFLKYCAADTLKTRLGSFSTYFIISLFLACSNASKGTLTFSIVGIAKQPTESLLGSTTINIWPA
tara:strand:+ start:904 stop:1104 length:201 start_codon:yes stop_codon:yes gene_type:complete